MDFARRAEKAYERGEVAHAVVVLVEGLKSRPGREEAGEFLAEIYTEGVETPGLERDVVSALAVHSDGERLASRIDEQLEASGREAMARDFRRAADEIGLEVSNPRPVEGEGQQRDPLEEGSVAEEPSHSAVEEGGESDASTSSVEDSAGTADSDSESEEQYAGESSAKPEIATADSRSETRTRWWPSGRVAAVGRVGVARISN